MQLLKADTQVQVVIGPFVDVGDGFTPETAIGNTPTDLTGVDEAELLKNNGAATVDIITNTWAAISGCDGYYHLTLTPTDTNTEGTLTVVIQDDSVCLPVRADFMVMNATAYDALYSNGGANLPVNVKAISDDTGAADNLELDYDGTGYTKTNSTIGTVTTTTTATNLTNLPSIPANWITTAGITDGTFTAAKFAASSLDGKGDWNTDTTATIVDAVWDEDLVTGHAVANSAAVHAKDTLADTNELQGDWADAGRLDAILDSRMAEASITTSGGAVTTVTTATNVTTVNGLAANTVTASALATDAVDEIVDAVWDEDLVTGHAVANSAAVHAKDILTDTNELQGDWTNTGRLDTIIDDILGRLPSTLVSGRIDASVGSMATDVVTASALATSAVDEIRDGLLPTQSAAFTFNFLFVAASDHVTPVTGATGTAVTRSIDGAAFSTGGGTITEIANGIYEYAASAGDMGGGVVTFRFVGTGGTPGAPDDCFVTIATGGAV